MLESSIFMVIQVPDIVLSSWKNEDRKPNKSFHNLFIKLLGELLNTIPRCRYESWSPKMSIEMLLSINLNTKCSVCLKTESQLENLQAYDNYKEGETLFYCDDCVFTIPENEFDPPGNLP